MTDEEQTPRESDHAERVSPESDPDRWTLIRDVALIQVKLVVDGLRDLLLVPASLIVGLISIFGNDAHQRSMFYRLVCVARQSERWINLFGAYDNAPQSVKDEYAIDHERGIDDLVSRVETFVVDEYRSGGVTAQAKERVDQAIDEIRRTLHKKTPASEADGRSDGET